MINADGGETMPTLGKLMSLNIARPISVRHGSKEVQTGIFKQPAGRPLELSKTGLEGDAQADLVNHGGADKAVCVYPFAHYDFWEKELGAALAFGAFGENFTVSDLDERSLCIGDTVHVGTTLLQVSQPRQPCFKLGLKHGRQDLPDLVQLLGYTGFYFRVLREGKVAEGDELILERRHPEGMTIAEANRLQYRDKSDINGMKRLLGIAELSDSWRKSFEFRLAGLQA
ncbi:MOSC domain-containing protein [Paenibacillus humicola]|uniref:MOSC domain-containing protein n=1 Tax=Paenibacillus humicola TaxID=3110540 RepID=UPI00237A9857|nr:MOSC domain-containing protein [Paenibacillus humicola]